MNVLADKLSEKVGENGYYERVNVDEVDPWGNKIIVKCSRRGAHESLIVRSIGPDGLDRTKDDIAVTYEVDSDQAREAISKSRQKSLEEYGSAASRGLTKGVLDAIRKKKD